MNWLKEADYIDEMNRTVLPWLSEHMESGYFQAPLDENGNSGGELYYEIYTPDEVSAVLVVSHGMSESVQKYKELIYYFMQNGYQVFLMDHRGHGKSLRQTEQIFAVWVDSFDDYVKDFHRFVRQIVKPRAQALPCYLFGHSMGGAIAALYLEQWPQDFEKAVLSSPMLAVRTGALPEQAAILLSARAKRKGESKNTLPGAAENLDRETFADSCALSEARFDWYLALRKADPDLQTVAVTYGWLGEAIRGSKKAVKAENASRVTVPVLLFTAGNDTLVDPRGAEAFASHAPNVTRINIPEVKHEIYQASDPMLKEYYGIMLLFLASDAPGRFPL